jgi:hypothetical protein
MLRTSRSHSKGHHLLHCMWCSGNITFRTPANNLFRRPHSTWTRSTWVGKKLAIEDTDVSKRSRVALCDQNLVLTLISSPGTDGRQHRRVQLHPSIFEAGGVRCYRRVRSILPRGISGQCNQAEKLEGIMATMYTSRLSGADII